MSKRIIVVGSVGAGVAAAVFASLALAASGTSSSDPVAPRPGLTYAYPGDQKPLGAQLPDPSKGGRSAPEPLVNQHLTLAGLKAQAVANGENITISQNPDGTFKVAVGIPGSSVGSHR